MKKEELIKLSKEIEDNDKQTTKLKNEAIFISLIHFIEFNFS